VKPTTDIFSFFRNLNVFVRNKKRFELKVIAVLLNAFGLSLRKTSSFFALLSEPISKSSVEEWTKKVEAKLSFDPKPREYSVIAVDETAVKCTGRPLYVWVAVDAKTRRPIWFGVSLTRTTANALRFLRRLRKKCLGNPVILADRGSWYREAVIRAGFQNHVHQTFGLRSSVERFFGYLKEQGCSTTTLILGKRSSHPSWIFWSYLCTGTHSGGDSYEVLSGQDQYDHPVRINC